MSCVYRTIIKPPRHDRAVFLGPSVRITPGTKVRETFIYVECFDQSVRKIIYKDIKFQIISKDEILKRPLEQNGAEKPLNVLLMCLDSVSRLNFHRNLPDVHDYLVNQMGAIEMKGLTRIGGHTLPNITPLLTGELIEDIDARERKSNEEDPLKGLQGHQLDKQQKLTKFDKVRPFRARFH